MTAEMLNQTEEAHRSGKLVGICPRGAVVGGPSLTMGPHLARTLIRFPRTLCEQQCAYCVTMFSHFLHQDAAVSLCMPRAVTAAL